MGDLIDATGHFRMRRLEADVERAESSELWGTSVITRTRLANKQKAVNLANIHKELNGLRTLLPWGWGTSIRKMYQRAENQKKLNDIMEAHVDNIILPTTLEED